MNKKTKISLITASIALTLGIHYGYVLEPIFGDSHWIHAVHGRFCYIPIVITSAWFGLRGGLISAAVISALVLPYLLINDGGAHNLSGELVEIIFYFAIAFLSGALIDREMFLRRKQEATQLQLERSQKLSIMGQMAAGVAHEIKNPLASIKGAVEIIGDKKTDQKSKDEFIQLATQEIKRIDGTVNEFLEFARPKETRKEKVNFSDITTKAIKQIDLQAQKEQKIIETNITENILINGDKEQLHQVILNIIINSLNAIKPNGLIQVELSKQNGMIELKVIDNGVGIPQANIDKIFEPFFTNRPAGTGLGLAIVKSIVENHNGQIKVKSKEGNGTEISILLPKLSEN